MDVLADLLDTAGVRGALGVRAELGRDWGWWSPPGPTVLHAVVEGSMWLRIGGEAPVRLVAGDVVLLPHGADHVVASDPVAARRTTPGRSAPVDELRPGHTRVGTAPHTGLVLCAHFTHDATASRPVLAALPPLLHVRPVPDDEPRPTASSGPAPVPAGADLGALVRLAGREVGRARPGGGLVLDRLVDVILVELVRAWLAHDPASHTPSRLCALNDPVVGAAVSALHAEPGREWTTEALASELRVSRATLARRFPAVVGETPGAYLTRWRMDLAARRLRDTDDDLRAVARSVGYTSAPAFNRAFRRARGESPGRYRTAARGRDTAGPARSSAAA